MFDENEEWPPTNCPPLEWPIFSDENIKLNWFKTILGIYQDLWDGHVTQLHFNPVSDESLQKLELQLACKLPKPLRQYHQIFGAISLSENLCSVGDGEDSIKPFFDVYPNFFDGHVDTNNFTLAKDLIVFGDYIGNGNLFCFHKKSAEVYYFDHDDGSLTCFFHSIEDYLESLMILCLGEIYDDVEQAEDILIERFGANIIKKWRY